MISVPLIPKRDGIAAYSYPPRTEHDPIPVTYVPLEIALTADYDTDAHIGAYCVQGVPYRLNTDLLTKHAHTLPDEGVRMVAAIFDADGPGHVCTDEWWASEQPKIIKLLEKHPGGFVFRTKGGYRIVYTLPDGVCLHNETDASTWKDVYLAWCDYIGTFGIEVDRSCKAWSWLFRLPRATRAGVLQEYETIGDPANIGVWCPDVNVAESTTSRPAGVTVGVTPAAGSMPKGSEIAWIQARALLSDAAQLLAAAWVPNAAERAKSREWGVNDRRTRHEAKLALAGGLTTTDMGERTSIEFMDELAALVGDNNTAGRHAIVRDSFSKRGTSKITGFPKLAELIGEDAAYGARDRIKEAVAVVTRASLDRLHGPKDEAAPKAAHTPTESASRTFKRGGWDQPREPVPYVLEGLIPAGCVGLIIAPPGSGKSWITASMAIAVQEGKPWLGKFNIGNAGPTLFSDYECNEDEMARRLVKLKAGCAPDLLYETPDMNLDNEEYWLGIPEDIKLVIVDSLCGGTPGVDENAKGAELPLNLARALFARPRKSSVIFIHHPKKGEADVERGFGGIRAACDFVYSCIAEEQSRDDPEERLNIEVKNKKMRQGSKPKPFNVTLTNSGGMSFVEDKDAAERMQAGPETWERKKVMDALRAILKDSGEGTTKDVLAKKTGVRKEHIVRIVRELIQEGSIVEISRRLHPDGDSERMRRVVDALKQFSGGRRITKTNLCELAHVKGCDIELLDRQGLFIRGADGGFLLDETKWAEREKRLFNGTNGKVLQGPWRTPPEA